MGTDRRPTRAGLPGDRSQRRVALATAFSLLLMAVLAPFAQFGVLKTLIVPADAAATTNNIAASLGLFEAAIAAFLIVAILDVVVAWGFYELLRPVNQRLALLVGSLRVVYAAAFAFALAEPGRCRRTRAAARPRRHCSRDRSRHRSRHRSPRSTRLEPGARDLRPPSRRPRRPAVQVPGAAAARGPRRSLPASAIWPTRSGSIFIADYGLTISTFTFVGEALLIFWLFWRAATGISIVCDGRRHAGPLIRGGGVMTPITAANPFARILGGLLMNDSSRSTSGRSPVLAIFASLVAGLVLAIALASQPGIGRLGTGGHRVRYVRLRPRLGPDGPAVHPLQRPTAGLDRSAGDLSSARSGSA